jgi:hypothetical protein
MRGKVIVSLRSPCHRDRPRRLEPDALHLSAVNKV